MNDLGIKREPHPAKKVLEKYDVPLWAVAEKLNLSYSHVSGILNGSIRCSEKHNEVLENTVRDLEAGCEKSQKT